jgi:branched-chain amino acid transport system substrate-binding protein
MSNRLFWLPGILVVAGIILAACTGAQPAAPAEEKPAAVEEKPAEVAATEEMAASESCPDTIGCLEIAADDSIHLAWIQTVSGATGPLGMDNVRAVEIAIEDKGGELLGHPLELTGEDSSAAPKAAKPPEPKLPPTRR